MRRIVQHVYQSFPDRCSLRGDSVTRGIIERAIKKANSYGLRVTTDTQQYVDLVMVLGEDFEDKAEFRLVRDILNDNTPAKSPFRATWAYDCVVRFLKRREFDGRG